MPEEEPGAGERAAIEEWLEDERQGRQTPAFDSAADFVRYRGTRDDRKLVGTDPI